MYITLFIVHFYVGRTIKQWTLIFIEDNYRLFVGHKGNIVGKESLLFINKKWSIAHTRVTSKRSSFLLVNMANLCAKVHQMWIWCEICGVLMQNSGFTLKRLLDFACEVTLAKVNVIIIYFKTKQKLAKVRRHPVEGPILGAISLLPNLRLTNCQVFGQVWVHF